MAALGRRLVEEVCELDTGAGKTCETVPQAYLSLVVVALCESGGPPSPFSVASLWVLL